MEKLLRKLDGEPMEEEDEILALKREAGLPVDDEEMPDGRNGKDKLADFQAFGDFPPMQTLLGKLREQGCKVDELELWDALCGRGVIQSPLQNDVVFLESLLESLKREPKFRKASKHQKPGRKENGFKEGIFTATVSMAKSLLPDFNNLLAVVSSTLGVADKDLQQPDEIAEEKLISRKTIALLLAELEEFKRLRELFAEMTQLDNEPVILPIKVELFLERILESFKEQLEQEGIATTIEIAKQTEEICSDSKMLKRMMQIFIDNAIEAMQKRKEKLHGAPTAGSYKPQLTIKVEAMKDDATLISVQDNGIGIPPEIQDKIIVPAFSGFKEPNEKWRGFSLTIANRRADLLGIKIEFQSITQAEIEKGRLTSAGIEPGTIVKILLNMES